MATPTGGRSEDRYRTSPSLGGGSLADYNRDEAISLPAADSYGSARTISRKRRAAAVSRVVG